VCAGESCPAPLSLWNDGAPAKTALVEYVESVTRAGSPDFIPEESRIAVFDLDGTLMLETAPTYFDWVMFLHRVLDDPTCHVPPEVLEIARKSRYEGMIPKLTPDRERIVAQAYKGMTISEFDDFVRRFMEEPQPGFTGMKRGEAFYLPMVEVVRYLSAHGFSVYVSSGSNRMIVRPLVARNLGLPAARVMGSDASIVASGQGDGEASWLYHEFNRSDKLVLEGKNVLKNLQMNKVTAIIREIGTKPVLSFGNSFTDASMANYVLGGNDYRAQAYMLLCDDTVRENGNLKKADEMRKACGENGWIPVSMRDDWKTIYGKAGNPRIKGQR
jgi:phosphoserine phosphatase